jgi:hypothetical protein
MTWLLVGLTFSELAKNLLLSLENPVSVFSTVTLTKIWTAHRTLLSCQSLVGVWHLKTTSDLRDSSTESFYMDLVACWDVSVNTVLCTQISDNKLPYDSGTSSEKWHFQRANKLLKMKLKQCFPVIHRDIFSEERGYQYDKTLTLPSYCCK